jgi:hypothetical protein
MEKIDDEKKNPAAMRRGFISLALAALGGLALGALNQVKKVEADTGDPLLIGKPNTGDAQTELVSNVGPSGIVLHIENSADDGGGIVVRSKGSGIGIQAFSDSNSGVYGESQTQHGVRGRCLGDAAGVVGESSGNGVEGRSPTTGVMGVTDSPDGTGVRGEASATSGHTRGVSGGVYSPDGVAVEGSSDATSGIGRGVIGVSKSPDGVGVEGIASATSGRPNGVRGWTDSPQGVGVRGIAKAVTAGDGLAGVDGTAEATSGIGMGVRGFAYSPDGIGVHGRAWATSGQCKGVEGMSDSPDGVGVKGGCSGGTGVYGGGRVGVRGDSNNPKGIGVWGFIRGDGGIGVLASSGTGRALVVDGVASFSTAGAGLIPAKSSSVDVADARVTGNSHITLTFTDDPGNASVQWISRKPGVGFTVNLTQKVKGNISFTYLIVEPS